MAYLKYLFVACIVKKSTGGCQTGKLRQRMVVGFPQSQGDEQLFPGTDQSTLLRD